MNRAETNKKICDACGTSVVNHRFLLVSSILDDTMGKIDEVFSKILKNNKWNNIASSIEKILHNFLHIIGIVKYNDDIEKASTGRSKMIWEEAQRRGILMQQVKVFGKCIDHYRAKINDKFFYFQSLPIPPWFSQKGYGWLDDKLILAKALTDKGIPAPKTREAKNFKETLKAFKELEKPVIIKPKLGSRQRHTTTNINTKEELEYAFNSARLITNSVVIQEHLYGSVYRATVIENKLVGFFRGDPPKVTGDGTKNIKELIQEKNKNHNERLSDISINDELINFIKREGYTLESILSKDKTINLTGKTGRMYGGYTKEMLPEVHPKMHQIFKKAGGIVSVPVAGFDLIIEDPTKDPDLQKWGIIECNSLPFIDLHYFALEGTPINLAINVWNLWNT